MQTFLQNAANYIYHTYKEHISELCIIVPSKRASFYFKDELAKVADEPIWSPEVSPMEEFICRLARVEVVEPITLQLELYDIIRKFDPGIDFDYFVTWADTLLDDFNRLDQNLVDPENLFEYVSQAKALERWDPQNLGQQPTATMANYFVLWDNLQKTYNALQQKLLKNKQAYTGMAFRKVAENIEDSFTRTNCHKFIFLGLNELNKAEEKIIKSLVKIGKAEVLFDSDDFYMDPKTQNRAGYFLKKYKKTMGLPEWRWQTNQLLTDTKNIQVMGVANASMQGKIAGQLLQQIREKKPDAKVAIILPDETMLLPVLHSIDPSVPDYNVTMGLTFKGTPLFNLIDLLFETHLTGVLQPSDSGYKVYQYHHLSVTKLLTHPFIRRYEQYLNQQPESDQFKDIIRNAQEQIIRQNRVLLSSRELLELGKGHPLFNILFKPWKDCDDILASFYDLINLLKLTYSQENQNPIEIEYLYIFYTIVKRLDTIFDCREQKISVRSFKKFLYEQINQTRLPFSGEPISDVQIMGFLETRALDFENIIVLSVNENTLPQPKKHQSLMPYDVLKSFGLPTYAEQEAITSYQFYRLLQRAKNINLLYVLPSDTYGSGEKSRFILQLQHELAPRNLKITFKNLTAVVDQTHDKKYDGDIVIQKDKQVLEKLRAELERGLYPSHLNSYINCSLQYYFNRIAKIQETDEVEEQLGADQFGNIVHKVLEDFFQPFADSELHVTETDLKKMLELLPAKVALEFKRGILESLPQQGMNYILQQVAIKVIDKYLTLQIQWNENELQILRLEQTLAVTLPVETVFGPILVKIAGKADRIDRTKDSIRVIDYKTGLVKEDSLRIKPEEMAQTLLTDRKYDKVRQLWLYQFILTKLLIENKPFVAEKQFEALKDLDVQAGILSFRNLDRGILTSQILFPNAADSSKSSFVSESEKYLKEFVNHMLDPEEPIRKTHDLEVCQYCNFRGICAR